MAAEGTHQWPPQQLTYVAMVVVAGFAAYAAAISTLLRAALRGLVQAAAETSHRQQGEQRSDAASEVEPLPVATP